ncbi:two-partner secretion domain-containing protein, partial [Phascolarctobacterium sp.]
MGKYQSRKKKLIACAVIMSVQMQAVLPCYIAAAAPQAAPPVVNIAKPNESGLSHNKADAFNVGPEGLVFNNNASGGNVNTALAGQVGANANLGGNAAKVILQEVTGTGRSNLNGMMEIAGSKADLIVANPNGITGNNFGFINTNRAALVTGVPNIVNGQIDGYDITRGEVLIGEQGNDIIFTDGGEAYRYGEPVSKLDIMSRAVRINGELWAKEEINVITGVNYVHDRDLSATAQSSTAEKPEVALDIAALGGMYAGKIALVGTEKGLGMNIKGNISAQKDMTITNDGKITFVKTGSETVDPDTHEVTGSETTAISAGGNVSIVTTEDIDNNGVITAQENLNVQLGGTLSNSGILQAGAAYTKAEEEKEPVFIQDKATLELTAKNIINKKDGQITASQNLNIAATESIDNDGYMNSYEAAKVTAGGIISGQGSIGAAGSVYVKGDKITLNKNNIYTITPDGKLDNKNGVTVEEIDPDKPTDPETPETEERKPDEIKNPELPDIAKTTDPAVTVKQDKLSDDSLGLVADVKADGKYKPIIDHAANGVDLVQIAEANSNGVSRNLYSDFNIKSGGLILNNATKYVKTELGGYIDRNMFLAGNGARVILNEVTSSKGSTLNGYLEVAGNKASVVIANANGISVNGLGFINTDNVILSTGKVNNWADGNVKFSADKGDMLINGEGLNGRNPQRLDIVTDNLTVDRSELWGNELHISADGLLRNTSKVAGTENVFIDAGSIKNTDGGFIEAKKDMNINARGELEQNKATIKAGNNLTLAADEFKNEANSLMSGAANVDIDVKNTLSNDQSIILAGNNLGLTAADFANRNTALLNYGQNADINVTHTFNNDHATISGDAKDGDTSITTDNFTNTQQGAIVTSGNVKLNAKSSLTNNNANIYIVGNSEIKTGTLMNCNMANIHTGADSIMDANSLQNDKASLDVQGDLTAAIRNLTNQNSAYLGVGGSADINATNFSNTSLGSIFVTKDFTSISTGDFINEDGLIAIGGNGKIAAVNITNQNADGIKQGSVINAAGSLIFNAAETLLNRSSNIESAKDITVNAKNLINKKEIFETSFHESHEYISYKIPHLNAPNYYDAMRKFDRQILTGVIDRETDDADIIASGNINITLGENLLNQYSKINAGHNLTVEAGGIVRNEGYQGTIHYYDRGQDNHYWKYKKHRRMHIGCHWKYGTTVIPYYDHTMRDEEGSNSERRSLLGATGTVIVKADKVENKTYQATGKIGNLPETIDYVKTDASCHLVGEPKDGKGEAVYEKEYLAKENVSASVDDKLADQTAADKDPATTDKMLDISELHINSKIYSMNNDPSARYLIETNKKFAGYHEFLSSDYLLERVKADPEKVAKRLGDGYFEQQFVIEQISKLTGRPYLGNYGSDMEQFAALMSAGAVIAEEMNLKIGVALTAQQVASLTSDIVWLVETTVNGQKVLVPQVYLAAVRSEDLQPGGALIVGGDVEIYSKQDIKNVGTIKADGTLDLHGQNVSNLGGSLAGGDVTITADDTISNQSGSIRAKADAILKANNIINETTTETTNYRELQQTAVGTTASITAGNDLRLEAAGEITNKGGVLAADNELTLNAGKNIDITTVANEKHVAVTYGSSAAEIHSVENQQSVLTGENIKLNSGSDIKISGGIITAARDAEIAGGGNVNIEAVKDLYSEESEVGHRGGSYYNHNKQVDETVKGSLVAGTENITVSSGSDINLK